VEGDDAVLELEVAAWTEGRECGFDDAEMRLEADCQRAPMDVVKLMGEIPGMFGVFYLEVTVWWVTG
jgi:hypothetical protein